MEIPGRYDDKTKLGVDGKAGYSIEITQTFGANAKGNTAAANTQTWQTNDYRATNVFVDKGGNVHAEAGSMLLMDTKNIGGKRTPLVITDTLGVAQSPNAKETVFMFETVSKNLGFNAAGKRLPTPAQQPCAERGTESDHRGNAWTVSHSIKLVHLHQQSENHRPARRRQDERYSV